MAKEYVVKVQVKTDDGKSDQEWKVPAKIAEDDVHACEIAEKWATETKIGYKGSISTSVKSWKLIDEDGREIESSTF